MSWLTVIGSVVILALLGIVCMYLPVMHREERMLEIVCTNANCGYRGKPSYKKQRSDLVGIFLFFCYVIPGIVYYIAMPKYKYWCPKCKTKLNICTGSNVTQGQEPEDNVIVSKNAVEN